MFEKHVSASSFFKDFLPTTLLYVLRIGILQKRERERERERERIAT